MTMIEEIHSKIARDLFEFSRHAVNESIIRHISVQELREAIANGMIIEER
jgi:hypothetical protein